MKSSPNQNGKEKDMDITSYVKAGYPLIYVCAQEADRATRSIKADGWKTYSWGCLRGITEPETGRTLEDVNDPLSALKWLAKLERMEGMFLPLAKGSRRPNIDKNLFEVIQLALLYQNPVALEYKPRKGDRIFHFEAHPYSMVHHRGDLYLLCYVPKWNGIRYLAVEGIKKAERSKERFEIHEDSSASDFLNVPFGIFHGKPISVKILFDKELADYIRGRTWHPTQKIKATGDGQILLSMAASGKEEIKAWILGFGPKAKVISPKSLRNEIEADLLRAFARYKGADS
jgi:predicted DNA-binding transcriptional regulator YafY